MKNPGQGICTMCGEEYQKPTYNSIYCPDCAKAVRGSHKDVPKGAAPPKISIAEICRRARAAGMSYGSYVAMTQKE